MNFLELELKKSPGRESLGQWITGIGDLRVELALTVRPTPFSLPRLAAPGPSVTHLVTHAGLADRRSAERSISPLRRASATSGTARAGPHSKPRGSLLTGVKRGLFR